MAFEITIPRLGWSMEEGVFAGWQKPNRSRIRRGDVLFELEGEKALQEIEAVDEGILEISQDGPAVGAVLKVGAVIGFLLSEEELQSHSSLPAQSGAKSSTGDVTSPSEDADSLGPAAAPSVRRLARQLGVDIYSVSGSGPGGRVIESDVTIAAEKYGAEKHPIANVSVTDHAVGQNISSSRGWPVATPRARRAAQATGVDLARTTGTGKGGRIRERDVLAAVSRRSEEMKRGGERVVLSGRRKTIATRLSESARQTVPVTITTRTDATNLTGLRAQFKTAGQSPVPAIHDIVAKLVGDALVQHPLLGARWENDATVNDAIVLPDPSQIHIGLAVDTPEGLIVPVLRNINTMSLLELASESARVIQKARSGRLSGAEIQGAVFTITNLGSYGIDGFTPVINLPEVAILGLGAIRQEPVVQDGGRIDVRQIMTLSLTFDHRAVDGAPAAKFLQTLVSAIENPAAKLIALG